MAIRIAFQCLAELNSLYLSMITSTCSYKADFCQILVHNLFTPITANTSLMSGVLLSRCFPFVLVTVGATSV